MKRLALAAILWFAAAPALARAEDVDLKGDLRAFCSQNATITKKEGGAGTGNRIVLYRNGKRRLVGLPSGLKLRAHERDGMDELLVEENGKFRRIVYGKSKIFHILPSPDGKKVAVIAVHQFQDSFLNPPASALYLFDTKTWQGEEAVKMFGYSGMAWSPDSRVLAYGDGAKLKLLDTLDKRVVETCGVDSLSSADDNERIADIGWLGDDGVRFTYHNARGKLGYVVKLK